jgi:hypothetical protein
MAWNYNYQPARYPLVIALSTDDGKTWSKPTLVANDSFGNCYPHIVFKGNKIIVFWWNYTNGLLPITGLTFNYGYILNGVKASEPVLPGQADAPSGGGGGFGGGGSSASGEKRFTSILGIQTMDANMKLTDEADVLSVDVQCSLYLKMGTQVKNYQGQRVAVITVEHLLTIPDKYANPFLVGDIYEITASGATFNPPGVLTLGYADNITYPQSLVIFAWDNDKWVELDSQINTKDHKLIAKLGHATAVVVGRQELPVLTIPQFIDDYGISLDELDRLMKLYKSDPENYEFSTMSEVNRMAFKWFMKNH